MAGSKRPRLAALSARWAFTLVFLLLACVRQQTITIEPPVEQFLRKLADQFEEETVLCLYGSEGRFGTFVEFIRPAYLDSASARRARYRPCPHLKDKLRSQYGKLKYLGTFHNHPIVYCEFSPTDSSSYRKDEYAIGDWLACKNATSVKQRIGK